MKAPEEAKRDQENIFSDIILLSPEYDFYGSATYIILCCGLSCVSQ